MTTYPTRRHLSSSRLFSMGLLAILACICANTVIRTVAVAFFGVSVAFQPLQLPTIIISTGVYLLLAIAALVLVSRISQRPVRAYRMLAVVCLFLSLLLPLMALTGAFPTPGMGMSIFWAMALMHVVSAAIVITLLPMAISGS